MVASLTGAHMSVNGMENTDDFVRSNYRHTGGNQSGNDAEGLKTLREVEEEKGNSWYCPVPNTDEASTYTCTQP